MNLFRALPILYVLPLLSGAKAVAALLSGQVICDGSSVSQARLVLMNQESGEQWETTADSKGHFAFRVPQGIYSLLGSGPGCRAQTTEDVSLIDTAKLTQKLELGHIDVRVYYEGVDTNEPYETVLKRLFKSPAGRLLIGEEKEPPRFGLYSYVLFGSRPADSVIQRYKAVLDAYIRKMPQGIAALLDRQNLNLTFVPLDSKPNDPNSQDELLRLYNYGRAAALLSKIPGGPHLVGPYLVSTFKPLSEAQQAPAGYLLQDLSAIPPSLIPLWINEFLRETGKEQFWKPITMPYILLRLRTGIEIAALALPELKASSNDIKSYLSSIVWKSSK